VILAEPARLDKPREPGVRSNYRLVFKLNVVSAAVYIGVESHNISRAQVVRV